ncbi:response regulator [Flavicella sediminum]|uniref:response regulator n=1 Tax=Flavicella sediminum TaxID=2585141 RepID=UPI001123CBD6|nr:response regulator transcription factor [Flavicella sediminum]
MKQIKVVIVDDHDLFRSGLAALLQNHAHINVLAGLSNGEELFSFLDREIVDVVLLDLVMPNMDGFQVLDLLSKEKSAPKVIVISMHDDGNYMVKCAKFGAYGYLLKNADEEELVAAIDSVYKGKKYYNLEVTEKMVSNMSKEKGTPKRLTQKETEILGLLSKGFTTKEIASDLFVSVRTVETHRANMLKKLEVKNSAELINKAITLKIL